MFNKYFCYVACPGNIVFTSSLGTSWDESTGHRNGLANLWVKSKALHDGCCKEALLGVQGPGTHPSAGTSSAQRDAVCPSQEHSGAHKGRNPAETKSWGCKSIPTANSHENMYTPTCWSFCFQVCTHHREWKWQKLQGRANAFPHASPVLFQARHKICPSSSAGWSLLLRPDVPEQHMPTLLGESPIMGGPIAAHAGCSPCTQGLLYQAGCAKTTACPLHTSTGTYHFSSSLTSTALPNSSGMKPFAVSLNSSWLIPWDRMKQSSSRAVLGLRHFINSLRFFISRFRHGVQCTFKVCSSAFSTNGLGPGGERELRT